MGKKLVIRGHSTRGKEVIKLLEMMGGKNNYDSLADNLALCYFIDDEFDICAQYFGYDDYEDGEINIFTLEDFLEKYPFKIGDKVIDTADGCPGIVEKMKWDEDVSDMKYFVAFGNGIDFGWYANDSIEFCKETDTVKPVTNKNERTHEDVIFDSIIWHLRNSVNNGKQNLSGGECEDYFREVVKKNNENKMKNVLAELLEHIKNTSKEELEKEFNELDEWSNVGPTVEEFMTFCECVNKKPFYPTTYEECCQHLGCDDKISTKKLVLFSQLINARNAYWKIAGEEMGLDEPWKPDWSTSKPKYVLARTCNGTEKQWETTYCKTFAFPSAEMRDAFYENFKDLIEQCKELL